MSLSGKSWSLHWLLTSSGVPLCPAPVCHLIETLLSASA
jgi:hypothetical protein